jgi:D-glycero-alpha-D-manno-heptose-7-phosphate kinase
MVIVRAPVRISFGGGGTDLAAYYASYGGFVVSAAITRYCYVVASPSPDGSYRINSSDYHVWESFDPGTEVVVQEPLILPKAAIESFMEHGLRAKGIDLFLASEVPPGTGLGSSSAMAAALVRALAAHLGQPLSPQEVAEQASAVEIERLGMPIGKQDQYASAFGGLNTIEFSSREVVVRPLRVSPEVAAQLSARLLLFATGQTRDSAAILQQQREDTSSKPVVIEALHRLKKLARQMCNALLEEDLDGFGRLLDLGWREKRRLSGSISSTAIDIWYEAACQAGALGGKITGAGGGGFLLLYCPPDRQVALRQVMAECGLREMPFDFDYAGAQVLETGIHAFSHRPGGDYNDA